MSLANLVQPNGYGIGISELLTIPWTAGFTGSVQVEFTQIGKLVHMNVLGRITQTFGAPVTPEFQLPARYIPPTSVTPSQVFIISTRSNGVDNFGYLDITDGTGEVYFYFGPSFSQFSGDSWIQGISVTYSLY